MLVVIAAALTLAAGGPAPTDEQLAGARVITGFQGRHPPPALREMISAGQVSGVILFDENVGGQRSVRELTSELQAIPRPAALDEPLIVAVDQEGGLVRRLPGPPKPAAKEIGARGAGFAERIGRVTGESLASMGVNVDLAPVLDIGRRGRAIEEERRAFARRAGSVARLGGAFARGLSAGGVAATAKHFPGLGRARVNTDDAVQRIRASATALRRTDERPFGSFVRSGGAMVMLSNAIYPAFSGKPAAFSGAVATGELRERLGFGGVSITDGLGGAAARAFGGPARTATAAARAGTDLVLFTDLGSAAKAQRALAAALRSGTTPRAEFEESVARVLALRSRL